MSEPTIPYLIAHRGYPARYPENTLAGLEAAMLAGACFVEIDIQLSIQQTPFLCHDDHLWRLTRSNRWLTRLDDETIKTLTVAYPRRAFYDPIEAEPLSDLHSFCQLLQEWPWVNAFIEIKSESIARFGLITTVDAVLEVIQSCLTQCIIISFDWQAIEMTRKHCDVRVGWVIPKWDDEHALIAKKLAPEFLFCSTKRLPHKPGERWQGGWQWVVYTVNDSRTALNYAEKGIIMVETDAIGTLLQHPTLKKNACIQSL